MSRLQQSARSPRLMENNIKNSQLLTRLDDALALYEEPTWLELRAALLAEESAPEQLSTEHEEWYRAKPERLAKERQVLQKFISPLPDSTTIFFHHQETNRIGASGLVQVSSDKRIKAEIMFPDDYPTSPPKIFFFGPALKKIPQLLRPDGSIPVPLGPEQTWSVSCNAGTVVAWALEWLEQTMEIEGLPERCGG